jgi:antibiotic biosynthesis monooxygenase (ABM) superfamily enzyme
VAPPRYKIAIVTWLAVYPAVTVIVAAFEPLGVLDAPLPIRTLLLTAVLVPLMVFLLVPALSRLLGWWLRR